MVSDDASSVLLKGSILVIDEIESSKTADGVDVTQYDHLLMVWRLNSLCHLPD